MSTRPTTDDEHAYLVSRGFTYNPALLQYQRELRGYLQYLTKYVPRLGAPSWSAVAVPAASDEADNTATLNISVSTSEGMTDVITTYGLAEVRGWRRP